MVGARQVGKTTLARRLASDPANMFDLEDPIDLARLANPMLALSELTGLVVIDEVQRAPDLFPVLRVLADRPNLPAKFLLLGSASPTALRQASESLTGRIETIELGGLRLSDVAHNKGATVADRLWLRGGFPPAYLARDDKDAFVWLRQYVRNLAQRDLPEFGLALPAATLERFLGLVAHSHGQLWNSAAPARTLGISETTARKYVDVLADALLIRVLPAWHENLGKRMIRSPKVYFRDSGLVHQLLGATNHLALQRLPTMGATWEGWVVDLAIRTAGEEFSPHFWRTSNGAELDLLLVDGSRRVGVEVKRGDAPRLSPSMRAARTDLRLDHLFVIYPGQRRYQLDPDVTVLPVGSLTDDDWVSSGTDSSSSM